MNNGITRRAALGAAAAAWAASGASAQGAGWPTDRAPVRMIVPFAAGGAADFLARLVSAKLQDTTGLSFAVENRTGGGGAIAWAATARLSPDATGLGILDNSLPIALALGRDLGFDARSELEPLTLLAEYPPIIGVHPSLPVANLAEFVAYAKARPGELFYGSGGQGSVPHLQAELLQEVTGIRLNHIPYRGMAQAVTDLVGGRLQMIIPVFPTASGQLRGGGVKPIAVGSAQRIATLPDVPTAREQGVDFVSSAWFGLVVPRGLPAGAAARMHAAVVASSGEELRRRMDETGGRAVLGGPEEFRRIMAEETALWTRLIREKGIRAE